MSLEGRIRHQAHKASKEPSKDTARELLLHRLRNNSGDTNRAALLLPGDSKILGNMSPEDLRTLLQDVLKELQAEAEVQPDAVEQKLKGYEHAYEARPRIAAIAAGMISEDELDTNLLNIQPTSSDVINLEKKEHSSEIRREYVDHALNIIREAVEGITDYTVFAGTALYLQGKTIGESRIRDQETRDVLLSPPGDIDISVWNEKSFQKLQERLMNLTRHPDVIEVKLKPNTGGSIVKGQDTRKWGGSFIMQQGSQKFRFAFEVFFNDKGTDAIVNPMMQQMTTTIDGFQTMTLEGLQGQYARNLQLEHRVSHAVQDVYWLLTEDPATLHVIQTAFTQLSIEGNHELPEDHPIFALLNSLHITIKDLAAVFILDQQFRQLPPENENERNLIWTKITAILGPFKTKVESRKHKVENLQSLNNIEIQ